MRKRLLSILLLCCMVLTLLPTTALAEEAAPAFNLTTDLADITIPDNLVTCICTKTNESRSYGQLPGGFSASQPLMEDGSWTVLIYVEKKTYLEQFSQDIGSPHTPDMAYTDDITTSIQFKLKYTDNRWKLLGEMPQNKMLHFTCSGGHVYQGDIPVISLRTRTDTEILVTENSAWEYSIDNGNSWQRSCLFKDLSPGTKYTIIARVRETATHKPSANSDPLNVTTMHLDISDELSVKLRAVVSAYKAEYDGKEHEAVIVDDNKMPEGWSIEGYTTDEGNSFGNSIPKIKDAGTLRVGVKFTHSDYLMNITHYYTAEITPKPVTTITEDDLAGLNIPANLVTVKCQTTGDSKAYGRITGGFDLSNATPYMENGVLKAIVKLNLSAYKDKYDADTKITHEYAGVEGNPHAAFTLKYVNDKWELDGTFPNVIILVKCDGQHPQTPPYPTEENVGGLEKVQVRVQCNTDPAQFKNYGILSGGVSIMPDANNPSQATLTLIPSVYSTQYSTDTGITHSVALNQTTDNLKIQMRYDPAEGKWMPAGELTPLVIYVKCNNHQGQRYTITFNGNGGTPSVTSMTTIDQKIPELPTATHSGSYSFDGWYTAASGGTKITTDTVFSANTTVYAHWTYTGGGWYYTYHTIRATSGLNGSISPSGWTSVRDGWDQTFTITPDKGYAVAKVLVDGKSVGSVKSYTFKNVTKDHTIEAIFMKSNGNPATGVFVDVAEGSYYEEAVDWAVEKGITNGVSSNMFAPNDPCTRAQIVTFLWRAAGSPAPKSISSFTDVPADAFYAKAVAWAVENGITSGTGESKFSPNATCTRAQAVTFLYRASGSPAVSGSAEFSDVSATAFYADAVAWAAKKGITTGIGGGLFGADNDCTRGQIVTFLWRCKK